MHLRVKRVKIALALWGRSLGRVATGDVSRAFQRPEKRGESNPCRVATPERLSGGRSLFADDPAISPCHGSPLERRYATKNRLSRLFRALKRPATVTWSLGDQKPISGSRG